MKWLKAGVRNEFVNDFFSFFEENNIIYDKETMPVTMTYSEVVLFVYIFYKPIGKKQIELCNSFIEKQIEIGRM